MEHAPATMAERLDDACEVFGNKSPHGRFLSELRQDYAALADSRREADELAAALESLCEVVKRAIVNADWAVDGRCDPDMALDRSERALASHASTKGNR